MMTSSMFNTSYVVKTFYQSNHVLQYKLTWQFEHESDCPGIREEPIFVTSVGLGVSDFPYWLSSELWVQDFVVARRIIPHHLHEISKWMFFGFYY